MARRGEIPKRRVLPDPKYRDRLISKFTNVLMFRGKRSVAERILYGALDVIQERYKADSLDTFRKALDACKPKLEVKSRRVGGATYQVPVEVRQERRVALAMRWLASYSRDRGEKNHGRAVGGRADGCGSRPRRRRQETGRRAQDGGGEQSVLTLPLVMKRSGRVPSRETARPGDVRQLMLMTI